MEDTIISKLTEGDKFHFKTHRKGAKMQIVPSKRIWTYLRTDGRNSYYTDGIKEFFTIWKRPVFKI